ncbi:MAG: sensor histidine kinase [Candidatus Omnitrophota bacterium]|nr:MAG: sensor histidine kinase [Candidatus Omnitrophota bacterium]
MKVYFREKRLLIGFGLFLVLTVSIGIMGLLQINVLTKAIENFEQKYLPKERVILEMKIENTFYSMGVRNYVSWRISKYLHAASVASDMNFIEKSSAKFKDYIKQYYLLADSQQEENWLKIIEELAKGLEETGKKLIELVDSAAEDSEKVNRFLISFENKFYRIDDLLANTLSKNNLKDIERQLKLTYRQKDVSTAILLVSLVFSILLGVTIAVFVYKSLEEERTRREWLVRKMIRLEEEERKNLSRQIHDQLSQDLSALKIYLELIEKNIEGKNLEQREKIEKSKGILDSLIYRGHNISELLRPPELDDLGLVESIAALVSEHQKLMHCKYRYYKPAYDLKLAPEYSLALYRVVQECLTNVIKHADARNVTVSLQKKDRTVYLSVSDDGKGFDYQQFLTRPRRRREDKLKLGLQGLRERIELLGGKLDIKSQVSKGTKISVELVV